MRYKLTISDMSSDSISRISSIVSSFSFVEIDGLKVPHYGNGVYLIVPVMWQDVGLSASTRLSGIFSIWNGLNYRDSKNYFALVDNVIFSNRVTFVPSGINMEKSLEKRFLKNYELVAVENIGKFLSVVSFYGDSFITVLGISDSVEDAIKICANCYIDYPSFSTLPYIYSVSDFEELNDGGTIYISLSILKSYDSVSPLVYPSCCPLDFLPILKILGG